jgi:quinone-modifying oxidoreductase subunit QmoC
MPEQIMTQVISPDLKFVKDILASGGEDLKKCYQCSTCTVVCNVTPDNKPFPRKEMMYAQWGLKEKLLTNPDIWLCHQCSDCTANCPRGAKPGEVLNAVRKLSIKHVSMVPFFADIVQNPKLVWLLFFIPIALFFVFMPHKSLEFVRFDGKMVYHMFAPAEPHMYAPFILKLIFGLTAVFSLLSAVVGVKRLWSGMKAYAGEVKTGENLMGDIIASVKTIFAHSKFSDCNVNRLRQWGHLLLLYSFVGLAITGIWALIYSYLFNFTGPYPVTDPMKILSQVSMLAFIAGIVIILYNRLTRAGKAGMGSYFDWIFLTIVSGIGATGLLAFVFRLANINVGYIAFYLHIVFVWLLLAYAPYSKFAHLFYRTTAMVFATQAGRDK